MDEKSLSLLNPDGSSKEKYTPKPGIGLQAAIMGANKGHSFLKRCLDWYENKHFIQEDGSFFDTTIAPDIYAMIAEDYGFRYKDAKQLLSDNMIILPSYIFAGHKSQSSYKSYAVHLGMGSWRDGEKLTLIKKVKKYIQK